MNKKLLLVILLPLLSACTVTPPSSSEEISSSEEPTSEQPSSSEETSSSENKLDLQTVINEFSKGIKVSSELDEIYQGKATKLFLQNTSKPYEFSFIQYKDQTRSEKVLREYYISLDDDNKNYVYATRLNVSNQYTYYPMYNPATSEYYTWENGYNNIFLTLNDESFEKIDDLNYSLKEQLLLETSAGFSTLIYGNPGLTLTSLTLSNIEDELYFSGSFIFDSRYSYTFNAKVIQQGENTKMDYRNEPYENINDDKFEGMLTALKANNYTTTVKNYQNNNLVSTNYYYTEEDKVYWETEDYQSGFYLLENNLVQEVYKEGNNFYKIGSPLEGSLDEVRPTLKISRACFDVNNDVYSLKSDVEGSLTAITILEAYADDLADFTIEINQDSYVFANIRNTYKTVVTFTNIGTTDCGFDATTVLEPVSATSWEEVLDNDSFELLYSITGEEIYNIPVPTGYIDWGMEYIEDEINVGFLFAEGSETLVEDLLTYENDLINAGYVLADEIGFVGEGKMFLKQINLNNTNHILAIELVEYFSAFAIAMYIVE